MDSSTPTEVTIRQLMELLESEKPPAVIDIRQPEELQDVPAIPTAVNIPMSQLMARLGEVPKNRPVILVCASGSRTAFAQKFLAVKGYDCKGLAGGMMAWTKAANSL